MLVIKHRVNTIDQLKKTPINYGVEIDLRSENKKIYLHHDPFKKGDTLKNYLNEYNHKTLILNTKESGIEIEVIRIVKQYKIKKFFLLDVEIPLICKSTRNLNKYLSIRFSEFEPIETLNKFKNNVGWVWIDTFTKLPITKKNLKIIRNFNSCLVCPERWGRPSEIKLYFNKLKKLNFFPNSVMTSPKHLKTWEKLMKSDT